MDDRTKVLLATLAGAIVGGAAGYLYLTDDGRRLRGQVEPQIGDFVSELRRLKQAVTRARKAADESWRTLQEVSRGEELPRAPARTTSR